MERLHGMIEMLNERMLERLKDRKKQLEAYGSSRKEEVIGKIREIKKGSHGGKDEALVITWLRSSYISGSHLFRMALYEEEPFMEESPIDQYCDLSSFFDFMDVDLKYFNECLRKGYIRISKSEMEGIRRYYLEQLYQNLDSFFEVLVEDMETTDEGHPLKLFFGEEMGNVRAIGRI